MNPWEKDEIVKDETIPQTSENPWEQDEIVKDTKPPGLASFVGKGVSEVLGAPVDFIAGGLNLIPGVDIKKPIGGSERMKEDLETVGIDQPGREAETIPEHIAQVSGESAAAFIPIIGVTKYLSQGAGLVSKISQSMLSSMKKHKAMTAITEGTAVAGAGTGRGIGEQQFSDNAGARIGLETAGGVIGGLAPSALLASPTRLAIKGGWNVVKKVSMPFTEAGSKYRSTKHIRGQVADPQAAIDEMRTSKLPPAVATGEKKIIQLYKDISAADPVRDAEAIKKMSNALNANIKELRKMGYDAPELLAEVTEKRIQSLEFSMDKRTTDALQKAQDKIDALPVAKRKVDESRIVRDELNSVMKAAQKETQGLWANVDKSTPVNIDKTQKTYFDILDDLPHAQKEDVPSVLKTNPIFKTDSTGSTIKEMQGLRSKLLETARNARKEGQWNKARISQDIADSIIDDIDFSAKGADSENLNIAIAATKKFKQRFEQGTVGKLLGYGKSGAPAIDPDITLDMSVGRMGQKGSLDIEKIAVTPEAVEATKRYINRSFTDYATDKTGKIIPSKARKWISNNEAILDKFPEMEGQLSDIAKAQQIATDTKIKMDARKQKLRDPKISTAAKYLNSVDMGKTVETILKAKDPVRNVDELMRLAKADPSGEAAEGLRGSFVEYILENAQGGGFNDIGEKLLSGRSLLGMVKNNRNVLNKVFTPEQISRIEQIGKEIVKIETFEKSRPGKPDIEMQDIVSRSYGILARVAGARVGGQMGASSAGGSLQMAQIYSGTAKEFMGKLTKDKAVAFIYDAIMSDNPILLKALLEPVQKPKTPKWNEGLSIYNPTINSWLAGTGKRALEPEE